MTSLFSGQSRDELRRGWIDAWRRGREAAVLTPLEAQIVSVVRDHPEYHGWLEAGDSALARDFTPADGAVNPFLHMSMHLAVREQVGTDRPAGIARIHATLSARLGSPQAAEHAMMEALGDALWTAQRSGRPPDEAAYLESLRRLAARR